MPLSARVGARTTVDVVNRPNAARLLLGGNQSWRAPPHSHGDSFGGGAAVLLVETLEANARRETFLPLMRQNPEQVVWLLNPGMAHAFRYAFGALKQAIERSHRARAAPLPLIPTPSSHASLICVAVKLAGVVAEQLRGCGSVCPPAGGRLQGQADDGVDGPHGRAPGLRAGAPTPPIHLSTHPPTRAPLITFLPITSH